MEVNVDDQTSQPTLCLLACVFVWLTCVYVHWLALFTTLLLPTFAFLTAFFHWTPSVPFPTSRRCVSVVCGAASVYRLQQHLDTVLLCAETRLQTCSTTTSELLMEGSQRDVRYHCCRLYSVYEREDAGRDKECVWERMFVNTCMCVCVCYAGCERRLKCGQGYRYIHKTSVCVIVVLCVCVWMLSQDVLQESIQQAPRTQIKTTWRLRSSKPVEYVQTMVTWGMGVRKR